MAIKKNFEFIGNASNIADLYNDALSHSGELSESLCPSFHELDQLSDRYTQRQIIGSGAQKEVFKCLDQATQTHVAYAQLRPEFGPEAFEPFINEARVTSQLQHPNIIKVFDIGLDSNQRPYFTMGLKAGSCLSYTPSSTLRSKLIDFCKVCDAIAYAHSKNILHLDLKPENIQTDEYGEVLVCDWGISQRITSSGKTRPLDYSKVLELLDIEEKQEIKGSLGYMPPEQLDSSQPLDVTSDIYALGSILCYLLTGSPVHTGNKEDIIQSTKQLRVDVLRLHLKKHKIASSLQEVILKCVTTRPDERYQSVRKLKDDVMSFSSGFPTSQDQKSFWKRSKLFLRRHPSYSLLTVAIFFLLNAVLFISNQRNRELERANLKIAQETLEAEKSKDIANYFKSLSMSEGSESSKRVLDDIYHRISNLRQYDAVQEVDRMRLILATIPVDDSNKTRHSRMSFFLDFVTLNFAALRSTQYQSLNDPIISNICNSIPQEYFHFSREGNKTINFDELVNLLTYWKKSKSVPFLNSIIYYDYYSRVNYEGYSELIKLALPEGISLSYDASKRHATLSHPDTAQINSREGTQTLYPLINTKSLDINFQPIFLTSKLSGSSVQHLDLEKSKEIVLDEYVRLDNLKLLIVSDERHPDNYQIKKYILSSHDYTIIRR